MHKLANRLESFGSPRIALVGDFMLDRYVYGDVERISPEAPVPILRILKREDRIGGAGNVAAAITALGAKAVCIGARGVDEPGEAMIALLKDAKAETTGLIRFKDRPTTVKARYIGLAQHRHAQQMFRVDEESTESLDDSVRETIRAAVHRETKNCKVLALEDYDKGVLGDSNTPQIISDAVKEGCTVIVDPARIENYGRYRRATLLTPNRYEAELASRIKITDDASLERAAKQIIMSAQAQAVVITLDREGAYLQMQNGEGKRISTHPRTVYDVSGAGDEVLAALAVAIAEGCEFDEAVALANVAGGLEVERFGVEPITQEEMIDELRRMIGLRGSKLSDRHQLVREFKRRHKMGEKIVFTNGCFDLLHMGHVRYLQEARELGSCLLVAINSDDSVRRLKGPSRPIISQNERAEMLGALECIDYVTIFDEDTAEELLDLLKPDIFVKGGTTSVIVEKEVVERYGGCVKTLSLVDGLSTTKIIEKIVNGGQQGTGNREQERS